MPLFAAGGEALIGPIDFTPAYLAGLVLAGAVLAPVVAVVARLAGVRWATGWRWGGAVALACTGAAAGWCLVWLVANEHVRANLDAESAGFLALLATVCAECTWGAYRLIRRAA